VNLLLQEVWDEVGRDYKDGLINSESCFQAVLYKVLREQITDASDTKVFVEPVIKYYDSGSPQYKPDLVICQNKKILAIIELKFAPNWDPKIKADLDKLNLLANQDGIADKYYVSRKPRTGEWEDREYEITPSTVFIIAVIGKHTSKSVNYNSIKPSIDGMNYANRFCLMSGKVYGEDKEPKFEVEGSACEIPIN
jgi:hypothetical protein